MKPIIFVRDSYRLEAKPGDLCRIHSIDSGSHDYGGELVTVVEIVDEILRSGRMCYAKVMRNNGGILYLSPTSLEVL